MGAFDSTLPFTGPKQATTIDRLNSGKTAAVDLHDHYMGTQTFRGLRMHRRAGSARRVMVTNLTEAVMHDGYRYSGGFAGLDLDTATSGVANGLTAAAVASTWYEIYAIAKSSDDTKALLGHRAKDFFVDQSQLTAGGPGRNNLRDVANDTKVGQGVTPTNSGAVEFVTMHLIRNGAPTGNVWVELFANNAGLPTGAALATSETVVVDAIPTGGSFIRFAFRGTPPSVVGGTQYHLVLAGDYAISAANFLIVGGVNTNPYAGGQSSTFNGAAWAAVAATDNAFQLFVTRNDVSVVPSLPAGYDRYCRLGFFYLDAASNVMHFEAVDRCITCPSVPTGTFTFVDPTLIDMRAFVPPVPIEILMSAANSVAANYVAFSPPHKYALTITTGAKLVVPGSATAVLPQVPCPPMMIEGQTLYAWVAANTGQLWIEGYRWGG